MELRGLKLEEKVITGQKVLELNKKEITALKGMTYAVEKEGIRPILSYIFIDKEKFIALDGYRLAARKHDLKIENGFLFNPELLKIKDVEKIDIYVEGRKNYFVINSDICYSSYVNNESYVNYKGLLPELREMFKVGLEKKSLQEILKVKSKDKTIIFDIEKNNMRLYQKTMSEENYKEFIVNELGNINVENYNNLELKIAFNKNFLKQALAKLKGKGINIYFTGSNLKGCIIEGENGFDFILPIRIIGGC